jgi:outer membrane lipoprotein-sorting protein
MGEVPWHVNDSEGHAMVNNDGDGPGQVGAPGELPGAAEPVAEARPGRRGRVLLPAAVAALVAVGVIAVPVFAAGSGLPSLSAQQLLAKALGSKVQTFSGTVQSTVDLGLPSQLVSALPSALSGAVGAQGAKGAVQGAAQGAGQGAPGASASAAAEQALSSVLSGTQLFHVAADGPTRQALTSADPATGFALVHDGGSAWIYDARSHSATHLTGLRPGDLAGDTGSATRQPLDPQQAAADALKALGSSTTVSVAGQSKVAGQSVYELSVRPKGSGSTVGEVRIAVDAANGVPLEVRVLPSDGSDPILDVGFSTVSFATPSAAAFAFTPPSGTTVTQQAAPAGRSAAPKPLGSEPAQHPKPAAGSPEVKVSGSGWSTVWIIKPTAGQGGGGPAGELSAVKEFGKPVPGGTLVSTKLVNVLVANDGTVYAGAVTPAVLEATAGR